MNQYEIDGQVYAAIDSELWRRLEPLGSQPASVSVEEEHPKRRKPKKQKPKKRKAGKYGKGNPMPEEVKEEIHRKYAGGMSADDLCKHYGVSVSSIWKVLKTKPQSQTTRHAEVHSYICTNGHEFNSKLQPGDVMCPTCHTRDCDLGSLNGPVKEQ